MRIDITEERKLHVLSWNKVTAYKKLSTKAIALLQALANGNELERPDLFRAAGYEANGRTSGGQPKSELSDYRLFATGLLDMRATGIPGKHPANAALGHPRYTGAKTYWTLSDEGRKVLDAALRDQINKMWRHIPI